MANKFTSFGIRELMVFPLVNGVYGDGLKAEGVSAFNTTPQVSTQDLVGDDKIIATKSNLEAIDITFETGFWEFEVLELLDSSAISVDGKILTVSAGQKKQPYGVLARVFVEEGDDLIVAFPNVKTTQISNGMASQAFAKCAVTAKALADENGVFQKMIRSGAALDASMFTADESTDINVIA